MKGEEMERKRKERVKKKGGKSLRRENEILDIQYKEHYLIPISVELTIKFFLHRIYDSR